VALFEAVAALLDGSRRVETIELPHAAGRARAWLHAEGLVQSETVTDNSVRLTLLWSPRHRAGLAGALEGDLPDPPDPDPPDDED
jgi:GTPase